MLQTQQKEEQIEVNKMESKGLMKAAKAEIIPNDDESKDIGIGGTGDDDEPHLYATISAEQKAKKGWVAN